MVDDLIARLSNFSQVQKTECAETVTPVDDLIARLSNFLNPHPVHAGRTAPGQKPARTKRDALSFRTAMVEEDDDDGYRDFVASTWAQAQTDCGSIAIECDQRPCKIISLTPSTHGYPYVNLWMEGIAHSFAGDGRHSWTRGGERIDPSAFLAIAQGVAADKALRFDPYPQNLEEALLKDRLSLKDKRFAICYRNGAGICSWRVVSRIVRQRDYMIARCHFRWGQRRTFLYDGLAQIVDLSSGEIIDPKAFAGSQEKTMPRAKNSRDPK